MSRSVAARHSARRPGCSRARAAPARRALPGGRRAPDRPLGQGRGLALPDRARRSDPRRPGGDDALARRSARSRPTPACGSASTACAAKPGCRCSAAAPGCSCRRRCRPTWRKASRGSSATSMPRSTELLGDLDFDGLPELTEWLRQQRRQWQEKCAAALAAAAARCENEGAVARGLVYAQRLVESDPLAEHGQRRLMRLHYLRGDRAAAIAAFERFEQRLKDELGTRPSAETIELLATIERGAASLPVRRATAPASLLRPPRLIGRERELQALEHAWANRRAFMLVGEAGIGKSRLLQDFCAGRAGIVVVQARPGDAGIAYAVLARLLRSVLAAHPLAIAPARDEALALVLPELGPAVALAGEAQRLLLQRAVDATLADALAQGLQALVVDDLHFADEASVEFLQTLAQSETLCRAALGLRPATGRAGCRRREAARGARGSRPPGDEPAAAARPGAARGPGRVDRPGRAERRAAGAGTAAPHRRQSDVRARDAEGPGALGQRGDDRARRPPAAAGDGRRAGRAPARPADERGAAPGPRRRAGRPRVQRRARGRGARGASARHRRALARAGDGAGAARRRLRPRPDLRDHARLGAIADRPAAAPADRPAPGGTRGAARQHRPALGRRRRMAAGRRGLCRGGAPGPGRVAAQPRGRVLAPRRRRLRQGGHGRRRIRRALREHPLADRRARRDRCERSRSRRCWRRRGHPSSVPRR